MLRSDSGFTLIEVLVSALMIILIGAAAATALIATSATSGDERYRAQADQLAAQDLARLQGLSDEQLNDLSQTHSVTLNGSTYTVVSTSTFQDASGNSGCAATAAAYFRTSSTVSWTENGGASSPSLTEDSLLSRPVSGDLHTQIVDQTGQGLSGASIRATPNPVTPPILTTQTATTDSTGCVLFAGLAAGAYTVTATDPGYMDRNGNPSPLSSQASVASSGLTSPTTNPFVMGLPGSIVGTFAGPASTTATAEADAMSWSGSGWNGTASGVIPATAPPSPVLASPGFTATPLFPFDSVQQPATPNYSNNYAVWGGRCPQQKPPAANLTSASVAPGASYSALAIQEPLLYLGSVTYSGQLVQPAQVKLKFQSATGTLCTDTWWATVVPPTTQMPSTGWLANPGQPYSTTTGSLAGTLTACVDYTDPKTGKTYASTVPITNGNSIFSSAPTANSVPAITLTAKGTC